MSFDVSKQIDSGLQGDTKSVKLYKKLLSNCVTNDAWVFLYMILYDHSNNTKKD